MRIFGYGSAATSFAAAFLMAAPQMAVAHDYDTKTSVHNFSDASVVEGAEAVLTRMSYGVSAALNTVGLDAGDAVTMWWVIFNRPERCSDNECGENDVFNIDADGAFVLNEDGSPPFNMQAINAARISIIQADGRVIDEGGAASFHGRLPIRDSSQAILGPGLENAWDAEIHLVLRSHQQTIPGQIDNMIGTINGGCSDQFPNEPCEDVQFAVFKAQENASVNVAAVPATVSEMIAAGDIEWVEAGPGSPISVAVVWGDPEGRHGILFKLPGGTQVPVHAHTNDYVAINMTGTWRHYIDGGDDQSLPAGSFVSQPGMEMHGDDCVGDEECIIYAVYDGPRDFLPKPAGAVVDLDQMREDLSKYKDINVALAEGYISPDNHCVSAEGEGLPAELGAMGIHYIHPALLEITGTEPRVDGNSTHTDWSNPSVLIYEPQADGSMELVAVENLVFEAAWKASGKTEALVLNGRDWDHMADDPATDGDEAHGFMPHFDQHVWLYRDNPAGTLMPFNPNVTCEHHEE